MLAVQAVTQPEGSRFDHQRIHSVPRGCLSAQKSTGKGVCMCMCMCM